MDVLCDFNFIFFLAKSVIEQSEPSNTYLKKGSLIGAALCQQYFWVKYD